MDGSTGQAQSGARRGKTPRSLELPSKQSRRRNSEAGAGFSQNLDLTYFSPQAPPGHTLVLMSIQSMHTAASEVGAYRRRSSALEYRGVRWRELRFDEWASFSALSGLLETMHDVSYNSRIQ